MENILVILKGITCVGKSTFAEGLKEQYNAEIISTDDIRNEFGLEPDDEKAVVIAYDRAKELLTDEKNVIIDATNLTKKAYNRSNDVLIKVKKDIKVHCYYIIVHPYLWDEHAKKRIETKWLGIMSISEIIALRQRMFESLTYPIEKYDDISFNVKDINVNPEDVNRFKEFYSNNFDLFLNDTGAFILKGIDENIIQSVLPEIMAIMNYDQQNYHHKLTLDKHTFKVCDNLPNTEDWKWIGLLHDVGKVIDGIKQPKVEDKDDYTYRGHAGASAEMSICIFRRLGFTQEFIDKVVPIINYHMYLPYDGESLSKKKMRILGDMYNDLVIFREADLKAK